MELLPEPPLSSHGGASYGGNSAFHNFFNDYSHIADPNLRRRLALSEIDKVPFGLYHVRAVLVAGIGFFLDSYDIFAINLITILLGLVFWSGSSEEAAYGYGGNNGHLPTHVSQALKVSTSAGIIVGQVFFGWLADTYGRRRMYGVELGIIITSTLSCALVSPSFSVSFTGLMVFWRVMMGVGIGGDYPLSSVITAEFAPTRWRGGMMAAVFSMQGMGQLMAAVVALLTTVGFKDVFNSAVAAESCDATCQIAADRSWRIIVGAGAVPAVFALYYRITIPETPRYTFDVATDVEKADADIQAYIESKAEGKIDKVKQARSKILISPSLTIPKASWEDAYHYFKEWKNGKALIGTTMSWFFLDLAFYGLGLNNTVVLQAIGYSRRDTIYYTLHDNAVGMIILTCAGSIPGYFASVFLIDTIGRKPLQLFGFFCLTIIFVVLGFWYHLLSQEALLALYIIAQFFFNFGPNTTTFVIPGECFPTRYRSTGHGISAAMGKVGAIIAQLISVPLLANGAPRNCTSSPECSIWLYKLMKLFSLFMFLGFIISFLVPETKGLTLEELSGEPPTSYNSGRNGSIGPTLPFDRPQSRMRRLVRKTNPFVGGQPAGFLYSRHGFLGSGRGNTRIGIMTSPEIAGRGLRERRKQQGYASRMKAVIFSNRPTRRSRGDSWNSTVEMNEAPRFSSPSPHAYQYGRNTSSRDTNINIPTISADQASLPGWGAGWGRIDRGPTPFEGITLQDVGNLLDSGNNNRQR